MNYVKKSLKVSLIDAIVVSIFAAFIIRLQEGNIVFSGLFFSVLFLLFFISSLFIAKYSKKEPISVFLYPFLKTDDFATLKTPFILSLIAYIGLFCLSLLILVTILLGGLHRLDITFETMMIFLKLIIFPVSFAVMIRAGLIFMARPETSIGGGIIVLVFGLVGVAMSLAYIILFEGAVNFYAFPPPFHLLWVLPPIMAIIGGSLGIKRGEKYYANEILKIKDETGKIRYSDAPFIILIMGFISAIVSSSLSFYAYFGREVIMAGVNGIILGFFIIVMVFPLAIISVILNIISMSKIRRETNFEKRRIGKMLIKISWCLIISSVVLSVVTLFP